MAIINAIAIGKAKGSLGNMTLRYVKGATVGSQKVLKKGAGGTYKQVAIRGRWGNLVNIYRAFGTGLDKCFETAPARVSDFNMFIKRNISRSGVYLTKSEANQGGAVIFGAQISEGILPAIAHTLGTGDVVTSDIAVGSMSITASTTLSAFSNAILNNNEGWANGDQLSAYIVKQNVNSETNVPYVTVTKAEITLDEDDEDTVVRDLIGAEALSVVDGRIAFGQTVNGAACYVHSRIAADGHTQVSTQSLVASNTILTAYMSSAQKTASIISYKGELDEAFITPNIPDVPITPVTP